jgi:hypothetical protein
LLPVLVGSAKGDRVSSAIGALAPPILLLLAAALSFGPDLDLPILGSHAHLKKGKLLAGANLTEQTRERFLRFRGLDTWGDDQTPWEEQGSEQAAEIIAWALTDKELVMVTMNNADPQRSPGAIGC